MTTLSTTEFMNNLNILISMGFDEPISRRAVNIYDDDLSACVSWIMTKKSLGSMPKRFKRGRDSSFNYTFIGSRIEIDGVDYYIIEFDSNFNLILLERYGEYMDNKWLPLGEPNIIWKEEKHEAAPNEFSPVINHYNNMIYCKNKIFKYYI